MNIMNPTIKQTSMHIRLIYNAVMRKPPFSYLQTEIDGYLEWIKNYFIINRIETYDDPYDEKN